MMPANWAAFLSDWLYAVFGPVNIATRTAEQVNDEWLRRGLVRS